MIDTKPFNIVIVSEYVIFPRISFDSEERHPL